MVKVKQTQQTQNAQLRHSAAQRYGRVTKAGEARKDSNVPIPWQNIELPMPRSLEAMCQSLPAICPTEVAMARAFLEPTPAERDYLDGPVHIEMQRVFAITEALQKAAPHALEEKVVASQLKPLYEPYFDALQGQEWLVAIDRLRRILDADPQGQQLIHRLPHATPHAATNARLAEATARILLSVGLSELSVKALAQAARAHEIADEPRAAAAACACVAEALSRFPEPNLRLIEAAWGRARRLEPQNAGFAFCHMNACANLAKSRSPDGTLSGITRAPHGPSDYSRSDT